MKTFLPQNKFYSGAHVPEAPDEAGASAPAPTPDAPADLSDDVCCPSLPSGESDPSVMLDCASSETAATDSCQEPVAADLSDCIGLLFYHARRLGLPKFAPDYEAIWNAMHDKNAPRMLAGDPVWADAPPLFLKANG